MDNCKESSTPMFINCCLDADESGKNVDQTKYKGVHNVRVCARFQSCLKESHLIVVKRILKYLKGTKSLGCGILEGQIFY